VWRRSATRRPSTARPGGLAVRDIGDAVSVIAAPSDPPRLTGRGRFRFERAKISVPTCLFRTALRRRRRLASKGGTQGTAGAPVSSDHPPDVEDRSLRSSLPEGRSRGLDDRGSRCPRAGVGGGPWTEPSSPDIRSPEQGLDRVVSPPIARSGPHGPVSGGTGTPTRDVRAHRSRRGGRRPMARAGRRPHRSDVDAG